MSCDYCLVSKDEDMPLIDGRAERNEWVFLGQVCKDCREYLRGIWRHTKTKEGKAKLNLLNMLNKKEN